ncbi:beta-1,3-N-acetylglucosaminyltransferase radical fringe [Hoplias malabaricus]|uniref:beta-1,3-N-acetylglucosaminyltransferase radical fringe n=1 Tax=Hoplias malabaricus TaxID=27720 RepID=UPI00346208A7
MHLSPVGISRRCFLGSLALCALLLLLIPTLQTPPRQGSFPQPRPQPRDEHRAQNASSNAKDPIPSQTQGPRIFTGSRSRDPLELRDIFIAVKTTRKYHKSRLQLLFQTWVSEAKEQTFIFTDGEDPELKKKAGGNIINTNCSAAHTRQALCCKMSVEYDKFIESQKKWFCHMDDDNYVILPSLLRLLSSFSHTQDVYLGRPSLDHPIHAAERVKSDGLTSVKFWFATGGAGFCISRGLALKMSPWASLGNFITTAEKIRLPDDCTVGYIIEALLEVPLTHTLLFHSHLENLQRLRTDSILKQVTLSYGGFENRRNVVSIAGGFSLAEDPSRFKTVHCFLYPETRWCPHKVRH